MKTLRMLVTTLVVGAVVFGSFFFVSHLLDNEMETALTASAFQWDAQFDRGYRAKVLWNPKYGSTSLPRLTNRRAINILHRLLKSKDPTVRLWCALIAAENGMIAEGLDVLFELVERDASDPIAMKAWYYLLDYTGKDPAKRMKKTGSQKAPWGAPSRKEITKVKKNAVKMLKEFPYGKPVKRDPWQEDWRGYGDTYSEDESSEEFDPEYEWNLEEEEDASDE